MIRAVRPGNRFRNVVRRKTKLSSGAPKMHTSGMPKKPIPKAVQAAETRQTLLRVAQELFAVAGYGEVSLDDILKKVRLTKGALYHHFRDKRDLFREVLAGVQQQVATRARSTGDAVAEPLPALKAVCRSFLADLQEPDVMHIVCRDAGAVLSWAECAEIDERHMLAVLRDFIRAAQKAGALAPLDPEATTRVLAGAIYHTVEWASHEDARKRTTQGEKVILRLIDGISFA